MRYPVTITPDDGQFTITFPDVPEAVTFGETRDEALERAADALLTIFDAFMKHRRDIPSPSQTTGEAIELPALESAKIELYRAMRARNIGKAELARRLRWHPPQVDRVLRVTHGSHLGQMEAAFAALGKKLVVAVVDSHGISPVQRQAANRVGRAPQRSRKKISAGLPVRRGSEQGNVRVTRAHAGGSPTSRRERTTKKTSRKR